MMFADFFRSATRSSAEPQGRQPYPYQSEFAERCDSLPDLLNVPTGVGKTDAAVLGWLYRRRFHTDKSIQRSTPRRLVYCLPMRTLVEQTRDRAVMWLDRLSQFAGTVEYKDETKTRVKSYTLDFDKPPNGVAVHLLMGGDKSTDWDEHPERDAILIGTQDMLLSRALNRGYGMSRYRWPMHFGLLNNDCFWVMDETQLMGVGLTTTAQLQGLRAKLATYGVTHSLWMSATLNTSPIRTVDHPEPISGFSRIALTDADRKHEPVRKRLGAKKALEKSKIVLTAESEKKNYAKELAGAVKEAHQAGTLTLVVMNRVARAQEVFKELQGLAKPKAKPSPLMAEIALVHARFRPHDRRKHEQSLFAETMPEAGRIVIATQAIEAGVDVSAATMFTELAPWPSLVQRFGRCNRGGEFTSARVVWIDAEPKDENDKIALPYDVAEFNRSREFLSTLSDVGPASLETVKDERPAAVVHTLRRKDLLDLWDTTPDLAGNDLDVSRFIRDGDDTDLQFFWRDFADNQPPESFPPPQREELCSVAIWRAREFLTKLKKNKSGVALVWKPLVKRWEAIDPDDVRPGMVLLLKPGMGGYLDSIGWTGDPPDKPTAQPPQDADGKLDGMEDDDWGQEPVSLTQHLNDVALTAAGIRQQLEIASDGIPWDALSRAALWHDVGKAHPAFQLAMRDAPQLRDAMPDKLWAKSGGKGRPNYRMPDGTKRNGFRHELASALAWLVHHGAEADANLIAFLIAAHHGKVRGSIRSLPNETRPVDETIKFARGVWDGDDLPSVDLGNGERVPDTKLTLGLMDLGEGEFGPSWLARVLAVRDQLGPFCLSYLETLLRIADWRGSKVGG